METNKNISQDLRGTTEIIPTIQFYNVYYNKVYLLPIIGKTNTFEYYV